MSNVISVVFLAGLLGCAGTNKQSPTPEPKEESLPKEEPLMVKQLEVIDTLASAEAEELGVPSMAVGIIRKGKLVSVKGYGTSSIASKIDADTVFRIGSVTKVFTATAAMRLRDDGKLSLEDPVAKHIPSLKAVLSPNQTDPVLIKHLLQHSSGIPTLGDGSLDWTQGPPVTEKQLIASVENSKLSFAPGTRSEYSNVGMALAGIVVARASGTTYRNYINDNILRPLGMSKTKWDRDSFAINQIVPGHVRDGQSFKISDSYWVLGAIEPAGGLHSTVGDMARFLAFQANPEDMPEVLGPKTVKESHSKTNAPPNNPMGMGWVIEVDPELEKIVWHNGATYSYGAWAGLDPKRGNGAVVFVSTGDVGTVDRAGRIGKDVLYILAGFEPSYTKKKTPKGNPTDPALVAEIGERVVGLINSPKEAKYHEIFSTSFLAKLPVDQIRQFLITAQGQIGRCSKQELAEDTGSGEFKLKLFCANTNINVALAVDLAPPNLLDGIQITPAP